MDINYRLAFELAPIGLALSSNRAIIDCNRRLCEMFGASRELLVVSRFRCCTRAPSSSSAPVRASRRS